MRDEGQGRQTVVERLSDELVTETHTENGSPLDKSGGDFLLKILRNLLLLTVNDCGMAVAKKTGLYGIKRIYPRSIHDLRIGDKVMMRTKGEIDREYGGGCFEGPPLVGAILITETMQNALGGTLTVGIIDGNDDTFNAYMDGLDYWWPLKAVEYIVR